MDSNNSTVVLAWWCKVCACNWHTMKIRNSEWETRVPSFLSTAICDWCAHRCAEASHANCWASLAVSYWGITDGIAAKLCVNVCGMDYIVIGFDALFIQPLVLNIAKLTATVEIAKSSDAKRRRTHADIYWLKPATKPTGPDQRHGYSNNSNFDIEREPTVLLDEADANSVQEAHSLLEETQSLEDRDQDEAPDVINSVGRHCDDSGDDDDDVQNRAWSNNIQGWRRSPTGTSKTRVGISRLAKTSKDVVLLKLGLFDDPHNCGVRLTHHRLANVWRKSAHLRRLSKCCHMQRSWPSMQAKIGCGDKVGFDSING